MRSSDLVRNRPPSWSYTDFKFRAAMPRIKSSQIHSSRAVAGRRLVYGGHAGVYHTTSVDPHACSKSCVEHFVELYPRLVFFYVLLSSRKTPDNYPSSRALGAAPAPTASRGAAMQREIGSVIPDFAGDCVSGAVYYQKYPFDRSNSGRSRRLRHGDEGRRAPSADVLRRVE